MIQGKIWTISNLLSISRIILMIPASYYLATPIPYHREIAILFILVAVSTDALDGYFARKFNEISNFGKIIDPLADKIGIGIVVVMLTIFGDIPLWFTLLVLFRDLIIFFAGIYIKSRTEIILPSLMSGKIAVSFLTLTLVFAVLQYSWMKSSFGLLMWFTIGLLTYSLFEYTRRFFQTLNEQKK
ncbi:MAG: CDP-alcohol phosphatidyltransferase family protein [Bacteroidota bacterium]|nr:CDP-alcohol phosphatidyltransferase family protein [Bacteroidota bacterium]